MSLQTECSQLQTIPLFRNLDVSTCKLVAMSSDRLTYEAGDVVFDKGEPSDSVYFLLSGRVRIVREDGETSIELGTLEDGNVFGETGVICGRARSATVVAAHETTVLRIERDAFLELLECKPLVSLALSRELARRLDTVNGRLFDVTSGRPAHG